MAKSLSVDKQTNNLIRLAVILLIFYTINLAQSLIVPVVLALFVALLLSPVVSLAKKMHVPRAVSAVLILAFFMSVIVLVILQLSEPARKWTEAIPQLTAAITERLDSLQESIVESSESGTDSENAVDEEEPASLFANLFGSRGEPEAEPLSDEQRISTRVQEFGMEAVLYVLGATPLAIIQIFTVLILLLFLLIFGPGLFAVYVKHSPSMNEKTLQLIDSIRKELSYFVMSISLINLALGATTALALYLVGVEDALFWGVVCGLFNFAPYLGPLLCIALLFVAGLVQFGNELYAIVPALTFTGINIAEAYFLTPMVLGQRMRLNPLILIIWIFLWGWLWGAIGVLLSVPLLVCFKMVAKQVDILKTWVTVIECRE